MKILFTGGSSFTGPGSSRSWPPPVMRVTAIFRKPARRVPRRRPAAARRARGSRGCRPVSGCSFGDESFLDLIGEGGWDLLCHHAADVTNYKSPDFDTVGAVRNNTHNLLAVLRALKAAGCGKVLLSGSVFEGGRGRAPRDCPTSPLTACPSP